MSFHKSRTDHPSLAFATIQYARATQKVLFTRHLQPDDLATAQRFLHHRAMLTDQRKEWDATAYHAVSDPQFRWGLEVLERVQLRGDETVLDAGCGTGRLTAKLAERLPQGTVLACDLSENMVRGAREFLAPQFGDRVQVFAADMAALNLSTVADGVFSTAAFHWGQDHDA